MAKRYSSRGSVMDPSCPVVLEGTSRPNCRRATRPSGQNAFSLPTQVPGSTLGVSAGSRPNAGFGSALSEEGAHKGDVACITPPPLGWAPSDRALGLIGARGSHSSRHLLADGLATTQIHGTKGFHEQTALKVGAGVRAPPGSRVHSRGSRKRIPAFRHFGSTRPLC